MSGGGQKSVSGDGPQALSAYVSETGSLMREDPRLVEEANLAAQGDSGIYLFLFCPTPYTHSAGITSKCHPVQFFYVGTGA